MSVKRVFCPLPDDKILTLSKVKTIKCNSKHTFVFHRVEKVVGKGENAGYQHFLLFPQCFQKAFYVPLEEEGVHFFAPLCLSICRIQSCPMNN